MDIKHLRKETYPSQSILVDYK